MPRLPQVPSVPRLTRRLLLPVMAILSAVAPPSLRAQAQPEQTAPPAKTDSTATTPAPTQSSPPAGSGGEVSTRDTPATFKVRVNLVLVRVVVRDANGQVIPNLKKEDFQLFDNRKVQSISSFSVETPASHVPAASPSLDAAAPVNPQSAAASLPQRFVALLFDDAGMQATDAISVRDAATRLFGALAPSDRVGMYTTSGQVTQEFTSDHEALRHTLLSIIPRPLATVPGVHECPDESVYQAEQINTNHDTTALEAATYDAIECAFNGDKTKIAQAESLAMAVAQRVSSLGDAQTEAIYRRTQETLRRLAGMPGQRIMVFVSPGFMLTNRTLQSGDVIDQANRANVVINTIDARGLYVPDLGDIGGAPQDSLRSAGIKTGYRISQQSAQSAILGTFADGTGGSYFRNRNDLDEGLRQAVAAPPISYLLSFSPQNLKIDGRYHTLKVALPGNSKYSIQARHGYYAPRTIMDPVEAAKLEIQEAVFSQEEMHDLPVDLQTQYFKADQNQAKLAVLAHVDVKGMQLRKLEGRNRDDLTIAMAIFDENGNYVTGGEKIVEMRLRDETLAHISRNGFTVKSSFDVKPGSYLVRMVVRDSEGSQMAARNGAVVIPN
jgi:VWFA-related protein